MKQDFCQKNLGKHEDVRFGADYSVGTVTNEDLVGFDLCVLGTSDHTIFTYGTFGMWELCWLVEMSSHRKDESGETGKIDYLLTCDSIS